MYMIIIICIVLLLYYIMKSPRLKSNDAHAHDKFSFDPRKNLKTV